MSWGSFALGLLVGLGIGVWATLQSVARALDWAEVPVPRRWDRRA